jgi:hypothetical protein
MTRIAGYVFVALLAGYGLHALAQTRPDLRQQLLSIGSSSSNGVSFAWFYDSTERIVYVCRTGQSAADPVECKARSTLQ